VQFEEKGKPEDLNVYGMEMVGRPSMVEKLGQNGRSKEPRIGQGLTKDWAF